jgi:hypothetical protein
MSHSNTHTVSSLVIVTEFCYKEERLFKYVDLVRYMTLLVMLLFVVKDGGFAAVRSDGKQIPLDHMKRLLSRQLQNLER